MILQDLFTRARIQTLRIYEVEVKPEINAHDIPELLDLIRKFATKSDFMWTMAIVEEVYEATMRYVVVDERDSDAHCAKKDEQLMTPSFVFIVAS